MNDDGLFDGHTETEPAYVQRITQTIAVVGAELGAECVIRVSQTGDVFGVSWSDHTDDYDGPAFGNLSSALAYAAAVARCAESGRWLRNADPHSAIETFLSAVTDA